jgi:hypothetical protein
MPLAEVTVDVVQAFHIAYNYSPWVTVEMIYRSISSHIRGSH